MHYAESYGSKLDLKFDAGPNYLEQITGQTRHCSFNLPLHLRSAPHYPPEIAPLPELSPVKNR